MTTTTSRAIGALVEIMQDHGMSPRRRIQACEALLDYESPLAFMEKAKAVLMSLVEDGEMQVDAKLDALKLLRRVEARKVSPGRAVTGANIELSRGLEIIRRRRALRLAGIFPPPDGFDDDLYAPDYVPLPDPEPAPKARAKSK